MRTGRPAVRQVLNDDDGGDQNHSDGQYQPTLTPATTRPAVFTLADDVIHPAPPKSRTAERIAVPAHDDTSTGRIALGQHQARVQLALIMGWHILLDRVVRRHRQGGPVLHSIARGSAARSNGRRVALVLVPLVAGALLIAGCGQSDPSGATSSGASGAGANAYFSCLQKHGVTLPTARPTSPSGGYGGGGYSGGGGTSASAKARQACAALRPGGGSGGGGCGGGGGFGGGGFAS